MANLMSQSELAHAARNRQVVTTKVGEQYYVKLDDALNTTPFGKLPWGMIPEDITAVAHIAPWHRHKHTHLIEGVKW